MKALAPNNKKNIKFYVSKYSEYTTDIIGQYFCKKHNSRLKTLDNLKRHLKEMHSDNNYKICKFCFHKVKRMSQHYKHCYFKNLIKSQNEKKIVNNTIIFNTCLGNNLDSKENNTISNNDDQIQYLKEIFKEAANSYDELKEQINSVYKSNFLNQISKYNVIGCDILGKGGFGVCCFALDKKSGEPCAIKFSSKDKYNEELEKEANILCELYDIEFLPKLHYFEESNDSIPYLVEDILGPSMRKIYDFCEGEIDIKTLCNIGIDLFSCLNAIHEKGILHRDIRLDNLCWDILNTNSIHPDIIIIDYGLSIKEQYSQAGDYPGNYEYAPVDVLEGAKLIKKHEILNILFILLYLYKGYFPWMKNFSNRLNRKEEIIKIKNKFNFLNELPEEIKEIGVIFKNVQELNDNKEPEYMMYQKILIDLEKRQKNDNYKEFRFIWEKKILMIYKEAAELKNPQRIKDKIYGQLFQGYPKEYINFALKKKYISNKYFDKK